MGLDSEYALKIRTALLRQIERNGPTSSASKAAPDPIETTQAA